MVPFFALEEGNGFCEIEVVRVRVIFWRALEEGGEVVDEVFVENVPVDG